MNDAIMLAVTLACLALPTEHAVAQASGDANWHDKTANEKWTWMEDYFFVYAS